MQLIFSGNVSGVDATIQVKPVWNLFVLSKYIIHTTTYNTVHRYYMLQHGSVYNVMSFYVR